VSATRPSKPLRTLCLGEALVDLICERPAATTAQADAFVPHFGGATANVAVFAARAGATVALGGGAGDDAWGEWLRHRLVAEGVEDSLFELVPGRRTVVAMTTVDAGGEARYEIYGEAPATVADAVGDRLERAVQESAALFISTNTLVSAEERELTMRARELALSLERPIVFDPNLRLHRWRSRADAAATANGCVPGALLVRCNASEAAVMTGEDDVERAATALLKAGARMVVITLGARGAILRGRLRADVPGVGVDVVSTIGAGDTVTGTLLGRLSQSGFYPPVVAASLREAVTRAAETCGRWGALD
jgi:sugar/nucleoside kinase (ribokinase family)